VSFLGSGGGNIVAHISKALLFSGMMMGNYGPWKEWFAWYPVKVDGKYEWFKTVYRRCINSYVDHEDWKNYEYGTLFDVLRN
jgi:hypothetical protein